MHAMAVKYGGNFVDTFLKGICLIFLVYHEVRVLIYRNADIIILCSF